MRCFGCGLTCQHILWQLLHITCFTVGSWVQLLVALHLSGQRLVLCDNGRMLVQHSRVLTRRRNPNIVKFWAMSSEILTGESTRFWAIGVNISAGYLSTICCGCRLYWWHTLRWHPAVQRWLQSCSALIRTLSCELWDSRINIMSIMGTQEQNQSQARESDGLQHVSTAQFRWSMTSWMISLRFLTVFPQYVDEE